MLLNHTLNAPGLDISDESIKVVQFKRQYNIRGGARLILGAFGEIQTPKGAIINGEIKNQQKLVDCIKELLIKTKIKSKAVVASLPEQKTFLKLLEIKAKNKKNLVEGLPKIMENHLPVSYKEIYADYQIIMSQKEKDGYLRYKVLFCAVMRQTADSFTNLLEQAGLMPVVFETEGVAIARSALSLAHQSTTESYAILDIGATSSNIIFVEKNTPALSLAMPVSGNAMTKTIAGSLEVSTEEAEKTKIRCGLDLKLCSGKLRPILAHLMDDVVQKTKKSIKFYADETSKKVTNIYLSGGGANMHKLDALLSRKLQIKVRKCDPSLGIKLENFNFRKEAIKYTTAIGLALRGTFFT